ncbi:MAG: SDR family NAD(P)-dependent oxidoreductase, partial [Propionibacteriaceae bacterium]|nr:SDR family NAD(P)-dependent oxidoreductase [Propionibacteriaceae bacterium]
MAGGAQPAEGNTMELNLAGRVAIVTGAARGIGHVIAAHLEREGATVYPLDIAAPPDGPAPPRFLRADITRPDELADATQAVLSQEGRIDILVNNAGVNAVGDLATVDLDAAARCFAVNVTGLLAMCQAVIPAMKQARSGRIVNAASFAAIVPAQGNGLYAASKAAVVQLTRVLAGELGPWDITVNAYAPGMVPTAINGFAELPEPEQDRLLDTL